MSKVRSRRAPGQPAPPPTGLPEPSEAVARYEQSHEFKGFPVAELRRVFAQVAGAEDWRRAWTAEVRRGDVERIKAASIYFHAAEAFVVEQHGAAAVMAGRGYQSW